MHYRRFELKKLNLIIWSLLPLAWGTACSEVQPRKQSSSSSKTPGDQSSRGGVVIGSGTIGSAGASASSTQPSIPQPIPTKKMCDVSVLGIKIEPGFESLPGLADRVESSQLLNTTEEGCVSACNSLAQKTVDSTQCTYKCNFGSSSLLKSEAQSGTCSGTIASAQASPGVSVGGGAPPAGFQLADCKIRTRFGVFEGDFIGGQSLSLQASSREVCASKCSDYVKVAIERAGGSGCSYSCSWNDSDIIAAHSSLSRCPSPQ